jgi:hypothetical protein
VWGYVTSRTTRKVPKTKREFESVTKIVKSFDKKKSARASHKIKEVFHRSLSQKSWGFALEKIRSLYPFQNLVKGAKSFLPLSDGSF